MSQSDAVWEIERKFGTAFITTNERGNPAIDKKVLAAVNKLTADTVVWAKSDRYWRLREPSDPPGRSQVD